MAGNDNQSAPNGQVNNLDALSQLIMNSVARPGSPLDALNSRMPAANPPAMPVLQGSTSDLEQRAAQTRTVAPQATGVPQPSDDPDITAARAGITSSQTALQDRMKNYEATQAKIAAVPPVNPADHQPKWYDRLLGAGEGFALGYGKGNAAKGAEAGADVTRRGLNKAESDRKAALDPLLTQLNAEREEIPLLNSSNETAWRGFEAAKDSKDLNRKQELADTKQEFDEQISAVRVKAEHDQNQNAIDRLNEIEERNKNQNQNAQEKLQLQKELLDLRESMLKNQEGKSGKGTPVQFSNVENDKHASLRKAQGDYDKATKDLDPKNAEDIQAIHDAHEKFSEAQQQAEDAYESQLNALGGSVQHQDVTKDWNGSGPPPPGTPPPAATPAAKPAVAAPAANGLAKGDSAPSPSMWKDQSKGLRVKQPSGVVQVWQLKEGKPTLVSSSDGKK